MNYQEYIKTELLILIPVLYFIGIGLKKSKMPDKQIPTVLGISAVVLSAIWVFATTEISGLQENVYTIVEEKNGTGASLWGRLKSGAGWISLDYVEKLNK